jgi:EAL domain-containing protein (putative c-di-GMP-specific phosphodiesterase class I)
LIDVSLVSTDVDASLSTENLHAVFQPIVDMANSSVFAHEGLIRGPADSVLHLPTALFRLASDAGITDQLEFRAVEVILGSHQNHGGRLLFVNFSARTITQIGSESGRELFRDTLLRCRMPARSLVIEITEHERVADHAGLALAIRFLRGIGVTIALDDFGDGSSSLRLWAELQPEFVKIDRYFCHGIHAGADRQGHVAARRKFRQPSDRRGHRRRV